jgi:hypothetical protein
VLKAGLMLMKVDGHLVVGEPFDVVVTRMTGAAGRGAGREGGAEARFASLLDCSTLPPFTLRCFTTSGTVVTLNARGMRRAPAQADVRGVALPAVGRAAAADLRRRPRRCAPAARGVGVGGAPPSPHKQARWNPSAVYNGLYIAGNGIYMVYRPCILPTIYMVA